MSKRIQQFINLVGHVSLVLCVLISTTSFDIKSQLLKSVVVYGMVLYVLSVALYIFTHRKEMNKGVAAVLLFILVLIVANSNIPRFTRAISPAWETQRVLYEHKRLSNKKIEIQILNSDAGDNRNRTVIATYITPIFMLVEPFDSAEFHGIEFWNRISPKKG